MMKFIPEFITKKAFAEYGETLEGAAEAIWQYNKGIVDAIYDLVPAVKPQIAMYEQFGIPGLVAFDKTVKYCKEKGLIVIGDIKRGDIGSTSAAYATGHLGKVQVGSKSYYGFDEDFATVNPYLGSDGVKPFIDVCKEEKKGIFVLVKTSNPSSGEFQDRIIDGLRLCAICRGPARSVPAVFRSRCRGAPRRNIRGSTRRCARNRRLSGEPGRRRRAFRRGTARRSARGRRSGRGLASSRAFLRTRRNKASARDRPCTRL